MKITEIWQKLKNEHGFYRLLVDLLMIFVAVVNISIIIFDWHFQFAFFRNFLKDNFTGFFYWYKDSIQPDFILYDTIFVVIFITELLISWSIAVKEKTYQRWWSYPLVHWYDTLGCIPIGIFRWMRLFRIISVLLKLHRFGIINLKDNFLYRNVKGVYTSFTNRVTDKVLINLVSGIQRATTTEKKKPEKDEEQQEGYIAEAVKPDQEELARVLVAKLQRTAQQNYLNHKDELKNTIFGIVKDGFDNSDEFKKIEQLPVVGKQITQSLESTIGDISYHLVESLFNKLTSEETGKLIQDSINTSINAVVDGQEVPHVADQKDEELNRIIRNILGRILERVKVDIEKSSQADEPF